MADNPHDKAAKAVHEGRRVEAQYVRQGRGGVRITLVLAAALILTAIGFGIVWMIWAGPFAAGRANAGLQDVDAAAFQNRETSIPKADAPTTSTGEPTRPATGEAPNVNAPVVAAQPSGSGEGTGS
jgi:hypothetical protein